MRSLRAYSLSFGFLAAIAVASAQRPADRLISFNEFHDGVVQARAADWVGHDGALVRDEAAFEQMRQHLATLYDGVHVAHTFDLDGDTVDCVPVEEQPSVRLNGINLNGISPVGLPGGIGGVRPGVLSGRDELTQAISQAPPTPPVGPDGSTADEEGSVPQPQWDDTKLDRFGNVRACAEGTIPMLRVTLEQMTRFPSLAAFFAKDGKENSAEGEHFRPELENPAAGDVVHKYAHANQTVNYYGAADTLSVWSPNVDTANGQIFSLAQYWVTGGSGANLQTNEGGWQNYPAFYGDQKSRLFIFYTSANYANGKGCYNLTCAAFVQLNNRIVIGGPFSNYATVGGTQYYFVLKNELYNKRWYLWYGNTLVGYYPASLYGTGQMSINADELDYGVETAGIGSWGPAGSGQWTSKGYKKAFFNRQLFYVTTPGITAVTAWSNLTKQEPNANCYTVTGPFLNIPDNAWGEWFYAGGPGC
jgi:hypothetical protein